MQPTRSLLLIAWLTLLGCTPVQRNIASRRGTDASVSQLRPDASGAGSDRDVDGSGGASSEKDAAAPVLDAAHTDSGDAASQQPPDANVAPDGCSGSTCGAPVDACSPNPCVHGTCQVAGNGYQCACASGYEGKNCEIDKNDCASNPCVHGTCTDRVADYSCACPAGWGGKRCEVGSCSNVTCPASAPCRVPAKNAGICYPSACTEAGLCLAENADGSGAARVFAGRNTDLGRYDWDNRARYFAYVDEIHGGRACVFPQTDERGTPLVIPLGTKATKSSGFGLSNSWPSDLCK